MNVIDNLDELHNFSDQNVAFIPTMGALHEGHAALIKKAREFSDSVLVSVFVNPLQFEDPRDLEKYPRTVERDVELVAQAGGSTIWFPKYEEIYPADVELIPAGEIGSLYEGASRSGHFSGVLTVVHRLFEMIKPTWAVFGEKDFQQLFLIRKMVRERKIPTSILAVETVREPSGLAISSRNVRLTPEEREAASVIFKALHEGASAQSIPDICGSILQTLQREPRFELDYIAVIDEETFLEATESTFHKRALVAGWINGVRMIDNMPMEISPGNPAE